LAKRRRRDTQHRGQESTRKRSFRTSSTAPQEVYRPGFPMNIFGNVKLFAIVGGVVAILLVVTVFLTNDLTQSADDVDLGDTPTPTATIDPSATPVPSASPSPTEEALQWTEPEQVIDAAANTYTATLKTSKGDIVIALDAVRAPNTVNSFVFLAQNDYFDGITFHRIVTDFIAQSGDPTATGSGGPGYTVADEPNQVSNTRGTISMAKQRGATSFGSQFFINLDNNVALDYTNPADKFYPFGIVTEGFDVLDEISAAGSATQEGIPTEVVTIEDVVIEETPSSGG
jgi:cyclophilin family peptidyl-prolyl cis-trans isomerase